MSWVIFLWTAIIRSFKFFFSNYKFSQSHQCQMKFCLVLAIFHDKILKCYWKFMW